MQKRYLHKDVARCLEAVLLRDANVVSYLIV